MEKTPTIVRKPLFFFLTGIILLLVIISGMLYREKKNLSEQNRQLIIQNDSILSVNIILSDSLKQQPSPATSKIASFGLKGGKNE